MVVARGALRDRPYDEWTETVCDAERQPLPRRNRQLEFRVIRARVGERLAAEESVLPMQRHGLSAPLLFELVGPFVRRRSAEVERRDPAIGGSFEDAPVEQMVRTE